MNIDIYYLSNVVVEGFLLGAASSLACIGVCAPIFVPFVVSQDAKPLGPVLRLLVGRYCAYALTGFLAGISGVLLVHLVDRSVFDWLTLGVAVWLFLFAIGRAGLGGHRVCGWLGAHVKGQWFPVVLGFVVGISPCPPFIMGLTQTMMMRSLWGPVVFFHGFFVGSSLWLLPLVVRWRVLDSHKVKTVGTILAVAVSLYYFVLSSSRLLSQ